MKRKIWKMISKEEREQEWDSMDRVTLSFSRVQLLHDQSVLKKGSDPLLRERRDSRKTWRILARSKGSDPFFNTLSSP
jgi:hypothetical protein